VWRDHDVVVAQHAITEHLEVEVRYIYIYIKFLFLFSSFSSLFLSITGRSCSVDHAAPSLLAHRRAAENYHRRAQFIRPEHEQTTPDSDNFGQRRLRYSRSLSPLRLSFSLSLFLSQSLSFLRRGRRTNRSSWNFTVHVSTMKNQSRSYHVTDS